MVDADFLGKRLISVLLKSEASLLSKHRIDSSDVLGDARRALDWTLEYKRDHSEWPNPAMISESTGVEIPDEENPPDYVANLVRQRSLAKRLERTATAIARKIEDREPDEALRLMSDAALGLRDRGEGATPVSFRRSGPDRLAAYDDVKSKGGLLGLPTPWGRLNANIQGWVDGTLNVITAMQNTGKTWFTCYCADHALDLEKRVLYVSLEMDIPRIQRRLDAIHYKVPFGRLRSADMEEADETEWRRRVEKLAEIDDEDKSDIILADKQMVQTVSDVTFLVYDVQPDIVFVDGGYRFTTAGGGSGKWENTVQIVNDLQISAEATGIPWVVSTQQGDADETGKKKKRGNRMHAWGVRYGKEWVINPDNVIGLYADEDLRLTKALEVHQLKTRDATGDTMYGEFTISWDLGRMDFSEIDALEDSPTSPDDDLFGSSEVMIADD